MTKAASDAEESPNVKDMSEIEVRGFLETQEANVKSMVERVRAKTQALREFTEQKIQIKRLVKRNRKIEKSIRKSLGKNMDVDFENHRCNIPFILVKLMQPKNQEDFNLVEHDGFSKINLKSSSPIECMGDA